MKMAALKSLVNREKDARRQQIPQDAHYETMIKLEVVLQDIEGLMIKANGESKALKEAKDGIAALKAKNQQQEAALKEAKGGITALRAKNRQQETALKEAKGAIAALQAENRQQGTALSEITNTMYTMQQMINDLQIYLRRAEPTDVMGNQEIDD
ncbi:uncharacterized protein [Watersipora subatra]|uniref:uncharacterized protein n=1 Tax=Watersipora subatra TaxID=2589382 RepID=UPI00355B7530